MSKAAVDVLRVAFEQFGRGDFGPIAILDDAVEMVTAPEMPDAGTYRGETARRWLMTWVESFEGLTLEAGEFIDAGDRVLVAFQQVGTPRGGRTSVELPSWGVYTLRGDLSIGRIELFMNREAALIAAGLVDHG